jgi:CDP-diacylglycerol--glycerol-3-phosphate 3-phosphatidyltransferase
MPTPREKLLTLPNLLSGYRLVMAPVLVLLALSDERTLFVVLLCVSFATDVLDGIIARAWGLSTAIGSRIDSVADELTYVAALVGAFRFEHHTLEPHAFMLYAFLVLLAIATVFPLIKFKKIPSFHLYSFKLNALFQAVFFFCLFVFDFYIYLYYPVFAFGILACLEVIVLTAIVEEPITNAKGLYWVLRNRRGSG